MGVGGGGEEEVTRMRDVGTSRRGRGHGSPGRNRKEVFILCPCDQQLQLRDQEGRHVDGSFKQKRARAPRTEGTSSYTTAKEPGT